MGVDLDDDRPATEADLRAARRPRGCAAQAPPARPRPLPRQLRQGARHGRDPGAGRGVGHRGALPALARPRRRHPDRQPLARRRPGPDRAGRRQAAGDLGLQPRLRHRPGLARAPPTRSCWR
jgi:hypothetical protein